MVFDTNIKSMFDLQKAFPNEQACIDYLEHIIWAGTPVSPFDSDSKVYKCSNNRYKCKNTGKYFNIKTKTFLENTKIPLQKWLFALWIITSYKKGISSIQLAKTIGITQKSAWFMAQRIRACFGIENNNELEGVVEVDESFFGGKNKNRHKDKKVAQSQGRSFKDKTPALGMLQRAEVEIVERPHKIIPNKTVKEKITKKSSKLNAIVIPNTQGKVIQPLIKSHVKLNTKLITDEWHAYKGLGSIYNHGIVDHSKKEYVNLNDSSIYSNGIEGVWGIMKRSYNGIYNWWSKKHMQKYLDEFVYRYNMKDHPDSDKFNWLIANSGVRTKYKDLIQ